MAEKKRGHPLSGEILPAPDPGGARVGGTPQEDVLDAEYETLPVSEARAAAMPATPAANVAALSGLGMLREGRNARSPARGRGPFWTLGLAAVAATFWVSGGHVLLGPAEAGREPSSSLKIAGVTSRLEVANDRTLLAVEGAAVNEGGRTVRLPDLSVDILGGNGRLSRYFLGTRGRPLKAGERLAFTSRLPAPKEGVKSVSVTFREHDE